MRNAIIKKVSRSIKEISIEFMDNPFEYFYEEDIRSALFRKLIDVFPNKKFPVKEDLKQKLGRSEITSSPIKTEYCIDSKKIDIAYLEHEGIDFYNMRVSVAIEIKLGSNIHDVVAGVKKDIKKLEKIKVKSSKPFLGIVIFFFQNSITKNKILEWFNDVFNQVFIVKDKDLKIIDNYIHLIVIAEKHIYLLK